MLAGAAGVGVIGAAIPTKADAADSGNVVLGQVNDSSSTTTLRIDNPGGGSDATLALTNGNGPSLALQALDQDWDGPLEVGEIVNTAVGPNIGVDYGDGPVTTFLATGTDLTHALPMPAERVLDTSSAASRLTAVKGSSPAPFDSAGRLKAGAYVDVAVARTEDVDLVGVFVNVTALASTAGGYLEVYTPGNRPKCPTVRYQRQVAGSNSAFVGPGVAGAFYTVRIFASTATRVLLEVTGAVFGLAPSGASASGATPAKRLLARQAKQRDRLVRSIQNR